MCLAVPGKVLSKGGNVALVDFGGTKKNVRMDMVDAKIGDYVIVHVGYAIEVMDEDAAKKTLELFEKYSKI